MQVDHNTIVRVHPSALAQIIDGHERREAKGRGSKNSFIMGTLMGSSDSKLITVDQAFNVDFSCTQTEDSDEPNLQYDFEFHFDRVNLIRAANRECQVMGWFSTANNPSFESLDKMVSDLYFNPKRYSKDNNKSHYGVALTKSSRNPKPIFLRVNCEILRGKKSTKSLPISAYLPEVFNTTETQCDIIWTELQAELGCGAAERTALDLMMKTTLSKPETEVPCLEVEAVGSNLDPLNNLTESILAKIDVVQEYIKGELEKEDADLDANIGRMLSEIFTGVPGLDKETMEGLLNSELTDLLMVTFLSHLAKVQVTLNDKLKQQFGQKTIQKRAYQKTEDYTR